VEKRPYDFFLSMNVGAVVKTPRCEVLTAPKILYRSSASRDNFFFTNDLCNPLYKKSSL